jgi:uncharacterized membrane protein
MYYVMGSDDREYGPFTAEQMLQWVAEGRANAYSRVRRDTESAWRALSEYPEFASAGTTAGTGPASVPPPLTAEQIANSYLARNVQIDIGSAISRGWELVRDNPGPTIGSCLIFLGLSLMLAFVPILGFIAMIVISGPLIGGTEYIYIRRIRGEQATAGNIFDGFSIAFLQLFLAHLVAGILTSIGFVLCILPGIYLSVGYLLALPLVIDKRMEFWTAMEVSRRVIHKQWWIMFGFALVAILIVCAGAIACLVGMLVAVPIVLAAMLYIYEDLFGEPARPVTPQA